METSTARVDRVLQTAAETVRSKIPLSPLCKCEFTESEFWFNFKWIALMVLCVGIPMIGSMVGFAQDPTIFALKRIIGVH